MLLALILLSDIWMAVVKAGTTTHFRSFLHLTSFYSNMLVGKVYVSARIGTFSQAETRFSWGLAWRAGKASSCLYVRHSDNSWSTCKLLLPVEDIFAYSST